MSKKKNFIINSIYANNIFQARSAKVHVREDGVLIFFMFYIAESDGKVHGTHPKLKKHTQIIYFSYLFS